MATFQFDLVSPEKLLFSGEVDQVDVPGSEGDFGVLAGHAPFVTTLRPGILTMYRERRRPARRRVSGGFAEVEPAGLTVLADIAVPVDDFDRAVLAGVDQGRRGGRRPRPRTARCATSSSCTALDAAQGSCRPRSRQLNGSRYRAAS